MMNNTALWKVPKITEALKKRVPAYADTLQQRLKELIEKYHDPVFSTSLAVEDMVVLDAIYRGGHRVRIFILNTGKLPVQTLSLLTRAQSTYDLLIEEAHPLQEDLTDFFNRYVDFSDIYESVDARLSCCEIRKVKPLQRKLKGADAWITGRRSGQSPTRHDLQLWEEDKDYGLIKYNPLFDWSEAQVWAYAQAYDIPVNELHHCGYPSIGCEPCTKAIRQGEDIRAGRWWWESADSKECGLHHKP